ncbi:MAG: threonine/serine exporter family protein [Oscillospiraceae bacterium]|nr:threonine/serine exporter family protein [Oscillospiraceae bacterium]
MDYYLLVDMATELGYELAMSGAETFRVEDSIYRVLKTYGIESEIFAITNCVTVSIETPNGKPLTRMRRIGYHGNDMERVERYNALSRRICAEKPDAETAMQWLKETSANCRTYSLPAFLIADFIGSFGFSLFFGGTVLDGFWAGLCGIIIGLVSKVMDDLKANPFFSTIASSFCMALAAYVVAGFGLTDNVDTVIIGALMILVPGLLFMNSMRDIIYGDTNSGTNRLVQVVLIAVAIALGTAAAWQVTIPIWGQPGGAEIVTYSFFVHILVSFIGCVGFAIYWNVHGMGVPICALGGMLTWAVYLIAMKLGCGYASANFWAAVAAAVYSEIMARVRKYPAITYLVVSAFPLLPGAGIYYTMSYILQSNTEKALQKGTETAVIAGVMAVGILLVSTVVRFYYTMKSRRKNRKA